MHSSETQTYVVGANMGPNISLWSLTLTIRLQKHSDRWCGHVKPVLFQLWFSVSVSVIVTVNLIIFFSYFAISVLQLQLT